MRQQDRSELDEAIVACYRLGDGVRERERMWWLAEELSFADLLERVGQARMADGKRHPHQRRLPQRVLDACSAGLRAAERDIRAAPRFHHLITIVDSIFAPIRGAGELAVYDAADRLRHRLGLESENLVYLHAGARIGARRLAGGRLANDDGWSILHSQLPSGLQVLSTHEAEDVLCIFKDELFGSPVAVRARWARTMGSPCADGPRSAC
ncbi:MAG: hypothetical protein DI534_11240 [Leifsonia xyli]|nr:MAG: hypothetical protein DI534_11240 [Leifsonia xyli]